MMERSNDLQTQRMPVVGAFNVPIDREAPSGRQNLQSNQGDAIFKPRVVCQLFFLACACFILGSKCKAREVAPANKRFPILTTQGRHQM